MIIGICATTRPGLGKDQINQWLSTTNAPLIMIVALYVELFEQLQDFVNQLSKDERDVVELTFEPYSPSFVYAVNAAWGRLRQRDPSDNLLAMPLADDQEFFCNSWNEVATEHYYQSFPEEDGLMFLNDRRAMETNDANYGRSGLSVMSAKFCDKYMAGWLASPYHHVSGLDIEGAHVAMLHGKYTFCPEAEYRHLMLEWDFGANSEARHLGVLLEFDRIKRNCVYDIIAPWRYWK